MIIKNLVTTLDLEKKYGVTRQSINLWRKKGMPYEQLTKRTIVYDAIAVEEWYRNWKGN